MDAVDAAAVVVAAVVALTPAAPLAAIRLGKLPVPVLPTTAEELLADAPVVPRPRVQARVRRSDELLTGMLLGGAVVAAVAQAVLAAGDRRSAVVLVVLVAAASLLRARLFPAVRHRVPLLAAGLAGTTVLALETLDWAPALRLAVAVPSLVVVAGLVLVAARAYRDRPPGPYLGRVGDVLDVVVVVAVVPMACVVIGLYGYVRGLYG
jgi:type VII secretion integral membrane protein EccD